MEKYFELFSQKAQVEMMGIYKECMLYRNRCLCIAQDLDDLNLKYKGIDIWFGVRYVADSEMVHIYAKQCIYECEKRICEIVKKELPFCALQKGITYYDYLVDDNTFENMLFFAFGDNSMFRRNYIEKLMLFGFFRYVENDTDCSINIPISKYTESGIYHFLKLCEMRYTSEKFDYLQYVDTFDFSVIDLQKDLSRLHEISIVKNAVLQPNDKITITLNNKKLIHIFNTMQFCVDNQ